MTQTIHTYLPALGIACPLGKGKQTVTQHLFNNQTSAAEYVTLLSGKRVPARYIPFELPELTRQFITLDSKNNRLLRVALDEVADAIQTAITRYGANRVSVVMATSTAGMLEEERGFAQKLHHGEWPKDYYYTQLELGSPSLFVAQYFALNGPAYTISTACSSGGKALCAAQRLIQAGICDAVITGGVDTLCNLTLNGFDSLELLSEKICTPFGQYRDGINIGEGAAVFLMTREPLADNTVEFAGGGETSDAYHISSPDPTGKGAIAAIHAALQQANLTAADIDYINLHGTGTRLNDAMESDCTKTLFGNTPCSSTKALTGHTLGAAGAIEAAFLWLALMQEQNGSVPLPPHSWDGVADPTLAQLHLTTVGERITATKNRFAMMSHSFAFGGSNVSVILTKCRS